ncbi:hypothetical protein NDU88_005162 [Pleurodeles waltl]|uniref:Uncharacterized protein n=1 Tax=Pleurodeles waltl TaxID=8319 RepID=A0AAV7W9N4_PLEWA|nr:hypothetical protein NDU88_005162 [Pleurodeles waltl]
MTQKHTVMVPIDSKFLASSSGPTLTRSLDALERAVLHPKKSVTTAADGGDCGGAVSALVQAPGGLGLPGTDESPLPCRRTGPGRAGLRGSLFQGRGGEQLVRTDCSSVAATPGAASDGLGRPGAERDPRNRRRIKAAIPDWTTRCARC